jgi:tetratricopeptide (TPR) repeat protein
MTIFSLQPTLIDSPVVIILALTVFTFSIVVLILDAIVHESYPSRAAAVDFGRDRGWPPYSTRKSFQQQRTGPDRNDDIYEWLSLVNEHPDVTTFHNELAERYALMNDNKRAIDGWRELLSNHPNNTQLENRLAQAYHLAGDFDEAMVIWLRVWKKSLLKLPTLGKLRAVCYSKWEEHGNLQFNTSLWYFAFLCLLLELSSRIAVWEITEIDWWPFAKEDDLMMVCPYAEKRKWHSV